MMFFFDPTPDTSIYMAAGYIIIFTIMLLYLISLVVRNRNLKQDLEAFKDLDKK